MNIFFVLGVGIALFIELLLISKKNKSDSDRILTLWMFLILLHLFLFYLHFTDDIYDFPFLLGVGLPFPLLQGVFLFYYVSFVTDQLPKKKGLLFLHLLPAFLMYLYMVPFFLSSNEQKMEIYKNNGAGYELFNTLAILAISISGLTYVIWSEVLLRRHRNNIEDQFSNLEKVNLRWLQILTYGMGGIWFLVIFVGGDVFIFSGVVVFVFLIGFFGVRQANIFSHGPSTPDEVEEKEKYQKSGLTEETSAELHRELKRLMAEEGLYKRTDLSITDLSSRLGVHQNYLSQVINQIEKKNFYDFVNSYRIEEFKRLLSIPKNQNLTLLSLAFDCGFNSKTSFNRCFKKATGQTPSQYFTAVTGGQTPTP
ncbi:MAG: helix-turn-helix domain-containing protein [Bacteroidota bacterium]